MDNKILGNPPVDRVETEVSVTTPEVIDLGENSANEPSQEEIENKSTASQNPEITVEMAPMPAKADLILEETKPEVAPQLSDADISGEPLNTVNQANALQESLNFLIK